MRDAFESDGDASVEGGTGYNVMSSPAYSIDVTLG
jgi:hypothetical protein